MFTNRAVAVLRGEEGISGTVWFMQDIPADPIIIRGVIQGLAPGFHGIHVYDYGDITNECDSIGQHYNPFGNVHGDRKDENRHAGDLGNIIASEDRVAWFEIIDDVITLHGIHSVIGRSFVVHADPDDLGRGQGERMEESLKTGNSGRKVACGVIGMAHPI